MAKHIATLEEAEELKEQIKVFQKDFDNRADRSLEAFLSYSKVILRYLTETHLKLEGQSGKVIFNVAIIEARNESVCGLRGSTVEESVVRCIEKEIPRISNDEDLKQAHRAGLTYKETD